MICGECGSGAFRTWEGCGKQTNHWESIAEVNADAIKAGWLLVYTPHGTVEAFVCPACHLDSRGQGSPTRSSRPESSGMKVSYLG